MKVFVLTATSESGDDYGPWVFHTRPSKPALKKFLKKQCPMEFEDGPGPGEWGSHLHVKLQPAELQKAPESK